MPAARRMIVSNRLYELEIRARSGLPFPPLAVIRLLLASAMARTQRDHKVVVCHFLWMANHLHLLFIAKDAYAAACFYGELTKKITDYMKRLLGLPALELWESRGATVSEVLDLESALSRITYVYCNPARADLVQSVDAYPGFSSWKPFASSPERSIHTELVPWIRQPSIKPIPCGASLSERQDRFLARSLELRNQRHVEQLTVAPNAWYAVFGVTDTAEIERFNSRLFASIREREEVFAKQRQADGRHVMGVSKLKQLPIMRAHTPERDPTDRKILFHTSDSELAVGFLARFREFCAQCREAFEACREGKSAVVGWPPGAFRPPMCPLANAVVY